MFCAVLDPGTGRLRYSSAGHPPAIVAHPGGQTQLPDGGRAAPLAAGQDAPRREARCTLPGRSALLLYTGGLVDGRRVPPGAGIGQAAAALHEAGEAGADDLASLVVGGLAPPAATTMTSPWSPTGTPARSPWPARPSRPRSPRSAPRCAAGWAGAAPAGSG